MSIVPSDDASSTPTRKAIPKRTRYEVLNRDGNTCRYCHATDSPLTIDHVIPVALGGTDDPSNLVTACRDCNYGKASSNPDAATVAQVGEDALRWAAAVRLAGRMVEEQKAARQAEIQPWLDHWFLRARGGWTYSLPNDCEAALWGFLDNGMPMGMLIESADIALDARNVDNRFRYFIGVARKKQGQLHEAARQLIADGLV